MYLYRTSYLRLSTITTIVSKPRFHKSKDQNVFYISYIFCHPISTLFPQRLKETNNDLSLSKDKEAVLEWQIIEIVPVLDVRRSYCYCLRDILYKKFYENNKCNLYKDSSHDVLKKCKLCCLYFWLIRKKESQFYEHQFLHTVPYLPILS